MRPRLRLLGIFKFHQSEVGACASGAVFTALPQSFAVDDNMADELESEFEITAEYFPVFL